MYSNDLIIFIVPSEKRLESQHLEYHAPDAPHVHLVRIVTVSHQAFRRSIPPRWYVFSAWLCWVNASTRTEVGELNLVLSHQNVLSENKIITSVNYTALCLYGRFRFYAYDQSTSQADTCSTLFDFQVSSVFVLSFLEWNNKIPLIASYKFISISSKTMASLPVGSSLFKINEISDHTTRLQWV